MQYTNLTFGCDPEFFIQDKHGNFVSSIGKVGGSKAKPRPLPDAPGSVQEDNVAVEFNIIPVVDVNGWLQSIRQVMTSIEKELNAKGLVSNRSAPSVLFKPQELKHPKAMEFGCEPDYDAWSKQENPKPVAPKGLENLRTAGGHIHVGYDSPDFDKAINLIRAMDVFLGVPSVTLDNDQRRRELYGKPGAFRFKPYGVEYRTLSNFWISDTIYMNWVWDQTNKAIHFLNSGKTVDEEDYPLVNASIMDHNIEACRDIIHKYGVVA